jgi:hypothetical protein
MLSSTPSPQNGFISSEPHPSAYYGLGLRPDLQTKSTTPVLGKHVADPEDVRHYASKAVKGLISENRSSSSKQESRVKPDPIRAYNDKYIETYEMRKQAGLIKPKLPHYQAYGTDKTDTSYNDVYTELALYGIRHTDPLHMSSDEFKSLNNLPDKFLTAEEKALPKMDKARLLQVKVLDMVADKIDTVGQRPVPYAPEQPNPTPTQPAKKESWLARKAKSMGKKITNLFN